MGYQKVKIDEEASNNLKEDAESYENAHPNSDNNSLIPVNFLSTAGSYIVRIFPDTYKGRTRIARNTFLHFLNFKSPSTGKDVKLRVVNDVRLSKLLEMFSDSDLGNEKYKYEAKEHSIMLCRVYQAPSEDSFLSKAIKESKDGFVDSIIIVKPRIMKEIQSRIGELTPSQRMEFLDIDTKTFALNIELTPKSGSSDKYTWLEPTVSVTKDQYDMGLPKFPEGAEWDGLEEAYIPESKVITDLELSMLSLALNRIKDRTANYVESKSKDGFEGQKPASDTDEPTWNSTSYTPGGLSDESPF